MKIKSSFNNSLKSSLKLSSPRVTSFNTFINERTCSPKSHNFGNIVNSKDKLTRVVSSGYASPYSTMNSKSSINESNPNILL